MKEITTVYNVQKRCQASFPSISPYIPVRYQSLCADSSAWLLLYAEKHKEPNGFDELEELRGISDDDKRLHASYKTWGRKVIAPNKFIVVADYKNHPEGTNLQIWTSYKPSFFMASYRTSQHLKQIKGTKEYDLNIEYLALPNYTIVRVYPFEVGFCYHQQNRKIKKMLPGRYILPAEIHFLGKARVNHELAKPSTLSVPQNNAHDEQILKSVSVLYVPENQMALVESPEGVLSLPHRDELYFLDQHRGYRFLESFDASVPVEFASQQVDMHTLKLGFNHTLFGRSHELTNQPALQMNRR